jgi:hypothetical protein
MYNSGVRILPDSNRLDQAMQQVNQMKMGMLQQDYVEKEQQVNEFKQLIDKSLHPVYGKDRDEYLKLQEGFVTNVAKKYKERDGKLNPNDYMEVQGQLKDVERFVAMHQNTKSLITDALTKMQFDTSGKIDKTASYQRLKDIIELPLEERYEALNSGGWVVSKEPKYDPWKDVEAFTAGSSVTEENLKESGDMVYVEGKTYIDGEKYSQMAGSKYDIDEDLQSRFGNREQYINHMLNFKKNDPDTVITNLRAKRSTTNTGLNPWGLGKGVPLVLKKDAYDRYNLETNARGKPLPKITIDEKMKTYDDNGNPIDVKASLNGTIIGFEQKEFEGNNELYARVKIPTGKDKNVFVLSEPSKADDDVSARKPKQDNRIVYYPVNKLSSDFFETHMIQLDGLNEFSGDDEYEQYFR